MKDTNPGSRVTGPLLRLAASALVLLIMTACNNSGGEAGV